MEAGLSSRVGALGVGSNQDHQAAMPRYHRRGAPGQGQAQAAGCPEGDLHGGPSSSCPRAEGPGLSLTASPPLGCPPPHALSKLGLFPCLDTGPHPKAHPGGAQECDCSTKRVCFPQLGLPCVPSSSTGHSQLLWKDRSPFPSKATPAAPLATQPPHPVTALLRGQSTLLPMQSGPAAALRGLRCR